MDTALQVFILYFSIVIHECSHGWIAAFRGDDTARREGRLTLNPLPHIDPFGTVLLPLLQWLSTGHVFFGYAKPVPINPALMKNPKRDILWVSLAGPLSNLVLGTLTGLILRGYFHQSFHLPQSAVYALSIACTINLWLALFNLIPVPPLDGSKIIVSFLPSRYLRQWFYFERFGIFILFALIATNFFDLVLSPVFNTLIRWIIGVGNF